ncbi:MAG: nucleotidyltransferase domain-containing protein [Candidatus Dependentiae bacterium]|nr:nucleotidyltransferase domain-containing protein [Candidatus Dependentiae bacterium]
MKKNILPEQTQEAYSVTDEKVEQAIKSLIDTYNPIFIYAFGSYARGTYDEGSDFDVMVVIDQYDDKPWKVMAHGRSQLADILMPIDLLVYDQDKFEACKNDITSFCHTILKKGKLLYERKSS